MSRQGDAGGTTGFDDWCSQAACMGNQCGAFKARVAYALRYAIHDLGGRRSETDALEVGSLRRHRGSRRGRL